MLDQHRHAAAMAVFVIFVSPVAARAQQARRVTLDEALALFAQNSIALGIARAEAAEAAALARQAGAFPNPSLVATHEPLSSDADDYSESYINLSQRLEWPGTRGSRRDAALRLADAARARLTSDSLRLVFEVKAAYTNAVRAEAVLRVLERVTQVFRDGEGHAETRYAQQDISLYEVRRLRLERTRYETRLADAMLDVATTRRALALLVAPAAERLELAVADTALGLSPGPAPGDEIVATTIERRPAASAALAALESQRASASLARSQRIPELTAMGGYKRQSDGLSGLFVGVSLPLPLWDRRSGAIDAADATMAAAEGRLALVRRQIENDVRAALDTYRSLQQRAARRATTAGGEGSDVLDIATLAYADGEMELIDLLDAADAVYDAQIAEAEFRANLWIAWYDLQRAVGRDANGREDT